MEAVRHATEQTRIAREYADKLEALVQSMTQPEPVIEPLEFYEMFGIECGKNNFTRL